MEWTVKPGSLPYREAETLIGLANGQTSKEMARDAHVSPTTINQAVGSLAHRFRLHTTKRTLVVAEAIKRGFLQSTAALLVLAFTTALATDGDIDARRNSTRLNVRLTRTVRHQRRDIELPFDLQLAA